MPRTKIVATLGPASSDPEVLDAHDRRRRRCRAPEFLPRHGRRPPPRVALLRETVRKVGRTVGIMVDLQGPKIRVGKFAAGKVRS
jgi:pyruvate kinase